MKKNYLTNGTDKILAKELKNYFFIGYDFNLKTRKSEDYLYSTIRVDKENYKQENYIKIKIYEDRITVKKFYYTISEDLDYKEVDIIKEKTYKTLKPSIKYVKSLIA